MKLIADLHIHSHFSRATSRNLTFEHLARWAQLKGIHVVGTGDIAHPGWLQEMREKLEPAEDGLFRLKSDLSATVQTQVPPVCQAPVRFLLGGEISSIYKRDDKTRKVHNMVFAPSFAVLERLQARLEKIGNIRADGRPILGLDSRDLLEIVLDVDPACHLIPAHIWTPWFSLLGSKSGFDSVEECFGNLTRHIFALETGLSSDPPMNWRVSSLDRYTLVSNSDAHSPGKLGREATLFDTELSYTAIFDALKLAVSASSSAYLGTIEFFPEEGKYHFDGHRACGIVWDPPATLAHNGICPVCGKEVTVGVMHRVEALADRPEGGHPARTYPFHSLVPLPEVLGEVYGVGDGSKQVQAEYVKLLGRLGSELAILRDVPLVDIAKAGGERLAEGIGRMRRGDVSAQPGYDGEYGVIRVFGGTTAHVAEAQMGLFGDEEARSQEAEVGGQTAKFGEQAAETPRVAEATADYAAEDAGPERAFLSADETSSAAPSTTTPIRDTRYPDSLLGGLNDQQRAAVFCTDAPLVIVAGPGTGKTHTLTVRIAHLIQQKGVVPEAILAITFTNKAAGEMRERLVSLLGDETAGRVTIKTFHAFGALLLREYVERLGLDPSFAILAKEDCATLLQQACPELKQADLHACLTQISEAKNRLLTPESLEPGSDEREAFSRDGGRSARPPDLGNVYRRYEAALRERDAVDFDDLILLAVRLLESSPDILAAVQARYRWISVDEYQDVNLAQYRFLRLLTHPESAEGPRPEAGAKGPLWVQGHVVNLCVIGDPDQAIYGFRGADRRYFLQFERDYPGAVKLNLSRNYRSSQRILDAAMQVIARNPDRQALHIFSNFVDEIKLDVYRAPTDKAEAEYVVHQIEQMVGGTSYFSLDSGRATGDTPAVACSFADFAVLYRLSAQSRLLVEAFDRSGIPYQTIGQTPLYMQKVVREALAYLWLLQNPRSRVHLETVAAAGKPTVGQSARLPGLAAFLGELEGSRGAAPVAGLIEQVSQFMVQQRSAPLSDADAGRLHQLALRAVPFGARLADFLEATALQSETDAYDSRADRVSLMTLHAAKGLEFPVVFITGCEEGLLPYERPMASSEIGQSTDGGVDVEEERRLFYVGLTRARNKLVLTHARTRFLFGQRMQNPVSPFVNDIEAAFKEVREMQRRPREEGPEEVQLSLF